MLKAKMTPFVLLLVGMLGGCESSDSADRLAKLQEQIGRVAQQLNETKQQVDGLQEANQRSIQTLEELRATIERMNSTSPSAATEKMTKSGAKPKKGIQSQAALQLSGRAQSGLGENPNSATLEKSADKEKELVIGEDDSLSDAPHASLGNEAGGTMIAMSCSQVWKQLGQGKTPESAARALGVSVAAIHACERKVGRGSASR